MAIRRSPNFRFDYFLRSLPSELIGRRCEQLMKAAEKEVEQIERKVREDAGLSMTEEEKKGESEGEGGSRNHHELQPVEIPNYRTLRAQRRLAAQREEETEHRQLEEKVVDIANQIQEIQDRLKVLNEYSRETAPQVVPSAEFPDELLPELANTVAKSGPSSITLIASSFAAEHPGQVSKKKICSKIDTIATKEKRESEGDKRPCWYLRAHYEHLLDAETLEYLQAAKEDRLSIEREKGSSQSHSNNGEEGEEEDGAVGPDGEFVLFPEYDGSEPPKDRKKAFTHFCNGTRKEVKKSLDPAARKNKVRFVAVLSAFVFKYIDSRQIVYRKRSTVFYEKSGTRLPKRTSKSGSNGNNGMRSDTHIIYLSTTRPGRLEVACPRMMLRQNPRARARTTFTYPRNARSKTPTWKLLTFQRK